MHKKNLTYGLYNLWPEVTTAADEPGSGSHIVAEVEKNMGAGNDDKGCWKLTRDVVMETWRSFKAAAMNSELNAITM